MIECSTCEGKGHFDVVDMETPEIYRSLTCEVCHGQGKI